MVVKDMTAEMPMATQYHRFILLVLCSSAELNQPVKLSMGAGSLLSLVELSQSVFACRWPRIFFLLQESL